MTIDTAGMTLSEVLASHEGAPVSMSGIVKHYSGNRALDGVDLEVRPGEFVALLGPSGCGKTTLLRALSGLEVVDEGSITIAGDDVSRVPVNRRDIGMVFQQYSLFPHMTVMQNVEFGLRMRRVTAASRRQRAGEALDLVGLGHLGARFAHQLSGGQQQRVALARALVTRPRVLLLDEPLSALDAKVRVQLRDEIRRIQTELGITTLFVTHDQEEALAVADRVAVMNAGRIEQIGTPYELYTSPSSAFVAEFVGLSNQLSGRVDGGFITVHGIALPLLHPAASHGEALAFVRPEDLEFVHSAGDDTLDAVVVSSSFLGSLRRTTVRLEGGDLVSVQHALGPIMEPGTRARIRFTGTPVAVRSAA